MANSIFKQCPNCSHEWNIRTEFLNDPKISLTGYQTNFDNLKQGLFLFDHLTCKTTLAIKAEQFHDMYNGPIFTERKTGSEECLGYCLRPQELSRCPAKCDCAWAREVSQIIRDWKKS